MRWILITAALFGASSIIIGAALKHTAVELDSEILQTALRYHQIHSVVLLALGLYGLGQEFNKKLMMSALLFTSGIVFFSGSLYGMFLLDMPALSILTPVGGIFFIMAWFSLICIKPPKQ